MAKRRHRWRNRRPEQREKRGRARGKSWLALLVASLVALLLHAPLLLGLFLLLSLDRRSNERIARFTEVSLFTPRELERIRSRTQTEPVPQPERQKEKPPEPPEDEPKGQVVELPRPREVVTPPQNAKYLAQFNSRTARETRKMGSPGEPKPEKIAAASPDSRRPRQEQQEEAASVARLQLPEREPPPPIPAPAEELPELVLQRKMGELSLLDRQEKKLELPDDLALDLPPSPVGLAPRPGSYQELLPPQLPGERPGNRGSDDYLPELPDGDELALNAREFKYWSFFHRVRENLKQHWHPAEKYRRRDPWGKVHGVRDRLTVLAVTLDGNGEVHDLRLVQPSGIDFLDEEAMAAFRLARIFPNPPPGLVEPDGFIRFRFGFAVVHNASDFRLFRYDF